MRKWNTARVCGLYQILMSTVFLLAVSPKGYLNISETKFAVFAALTALFLAAFLPFWLRERKSLPRRDRDVFPFLILGFWAWSLLSALCSSWTKIAVLGGPRLDGMATLTLYCLMLLALRKGGGESKWVLRAAAAAALLYCAVALLQFLDRNPLGLFPGEYRWSGRQTVYNGAFLSFTGNADLSASVLGIGFALFWSRALKKKEWLYLLPAAACLGVLAVSEVRGGLLAAGAGFLLCLPAQLDARKTVKLCLYAALGIGLLASLVLLWFLPAGGTAGELRGLLRGEAADSFGSGRIYIWRNVWDLVKERPLLGGGPDTLGERGLFFTRLLPDGSLLRRDIDSAHCEYLNILVNQGFPALLLYLASLGTTLVRAFRSASPAAVSLRAAMVTYLLGAVFGISMPANTAFLWLCWGVLEGALAREEPREEASAERERSI